MNPEAVEDASNDVMKIILDSKLALFTSDKVKLSRDYNILTKLYYLHEKFFIEHIFIFSSWPVHLEQPSKVWLLWVKR